jgi:hypothetical protein
VDAVVHLQTHLLWHLAPECFAPGRDRRDWAAMGIHRWFAGQMSDPAKVKMSARNFAVFSAGPDAAVFNRLAPYGGVPAPKRTWPHPELDEAVISLWPLVQRHNWSFGDLLTVLRDVLPRADIYPCENERNLATYCAFTLRLRRFGHGKTVRETRPPGYELATRLCLPRTPSAAPLRHFGPVNEPPPAQVQAAPEAQNSGGLVFDREFDVFKQA